MVPWFIKKSKANPPLVSRLFQPAEDKILEGKLTEQQHAHAYVYVEIIQSTESSSSQFSRVGGQETVNTEMRLTLDIRNTCFVMRETDRWRSCPERLCNCLLWRFLRPGRIKPWAFWSHSWPHLKEEAGLETFWDPFWNGLSCDPRS